MTPMDDNDPLRSFEKDLRAWGRRPPRIPASAARTRVLAQLPEGPRSRPWLRLVAAAAMLAILAVAVWRGAPRRGGETSASAAVMAPPPLDPNVVVWVIDPHTTVYFILSPAGSEQGGVS